MFIHSLDDIGTLFGILYLKDNAGCIVQEGSRGRLLTKDQVPLSRWHLSSRDISGLGELEWQYRLTLLRTYGFRFNINLVNANI